jgi:hypothetical protein
MSDLKTDLLRVIEMAEEYTGHLMPDERDEVMGWLTRVKARVNSGTALEEIRRQNRAMKSALEIVSETASKALSDLTEGE